MNLTVTEFNQQQQKDSSASHLIIATIILITFLNQYTATNDILSADQYIKSRVDHCNCHLLLLFFSISYPQLHSSLHHLTYHLNTMKISFFWILSIMTIMFMLNSIEFAEAGKMKKCEDSYDEEDDHDWRRRRR